MKKTDHKKEWRSLYNPSKKEPQIVEVPEYQFIMVDGKGDPNNNSMFEDAISTLYPLAYAVKNWHKKQKEQDYVVMPLQGLWWAEDMNVFTQGDKSNWLWTLMILQPFGIDQDLFEELRLQVKSKKNPPMIDQVRLETYRERTVVTLMHIGPFAEEGPNIARMHAYAEQQGYKLDGKHHEIYLSDFRKTAPEKLKTVIRQPISK